MSEKRKFKRFKKEVKIHFDVITAMGTAKTIPTEGETVSIDISRGGVLFLTEKPIPVSSTIECQFNLPEFKEPIYAKARVVRIEEIIIGKQYDIGIEFIAITNDDELTLSEFLHD